MKSLIKPFALLIILMLCSCSSEDDNTETIISLEGQWLVSSLEIESPIDLNNDNFPTRDLFIETNCYQGNNVEFFEDGTIILDIDLAYIFADEDNNNEYGVDCIDISERTSTWTQEGNTIMVENTFNDEEINGSISGNTITLRFIDLFQREFYNETTDTIENIEEDFTIVFTKV